MSVTLTFTATHRAGNFVRIFSALRRLGLKPLGGTINKSAETNMDSIQMNLEHQIEPATIQKIKEMVPAIVDVHIDSPYATRAGATTTASSTITATRDSAEIDKPTQAVSENVTSEQTNALPQFDDERLDFETKRLAGAYPDDIKSALKYLETAINSAQRQYVLTQLGIRMGMYAARKRKAAEKDSGINKTVRSSLAMQKTQFGRVSPVFADMMKKKAAKQSTSKQNKSKTLVSELNRFLTVSVTGNKFQIGNCPHCESSHSSQSPDCYFVSAFIDSFIKDMWGESKHSVTQTKSKATGASDCEFVVSGIRLK